MTYTEIVIDEKVKETRKLTDFQLQDLVLEIGNEYFETEIEILQQRKIDKTSKKYPVYYKLVYEYEDIEVVGVTLRQVYENLYEEFLKLVYADDLSEEYAQLEEFERQQIKKYNIENSGVPLGKVV
ncbi:MAG: hypothetical protein ACLVH8_03880 [Fusobacterium sp.]